MSIGSRVDLLSNASATGTGKPVNKGGKYYFFVDATFGGGTVKLQVQSSQGNWSDVASGSLTANGNVALDIPSGQYRANVATATAVYAYLVPAF